MRGFGVIWISWYDDHDKLGDEDAGYGEVFDQMAETSPLHYKLSSLPQ